ncbi:MAG TPA: bifunctional acetate--CoA ligase family protein/GNAT family N-acetyltransferase [Terriglobales bacterium]|nr:bifunctional acetate--CoA ligase family protein/GNAT family N-acetyltransferase [Terriglobales bacterium]
MSTGIKTSKPGGAVTHPAHDVLRSEQRPLDTLFAPQSVAVVGATEKAGSVGRSILRNLVTSPFGGTVFPIHPSRSSVLGIKAYPSIAAVPEAVELAVIATPAPTVPGIIKECVDAGVRGAIIISAGFRETGPAGLELEQQVLGEARRGRLRIIGPNCFGVMMPLSGMNATFSTEIARPGSVGFVSQSGALCAAVLDWSLRETVGFSAFVSVGSMLDVGWGDLIYYLGDDPRTSCIMMYMESIGDARSFLSAAREVAMTKPIIVIKAGRTEAAARAAASHTGALTGSDEVLHAAFRRCGVLRVNTISDLFHMAEVLGKQPRPRGPRLAIVTNAGGPGVLASDFLMAEGGELAELSAETIEALSQFLSPHWSHANPVDTIGDADATRYVKAVEVVGKDPNCDAVLAILVPQGMADPAEAAEKLKASADQRPKPLLASWMGGPSANLGESILSRANIPCFPFPETAIRMFNYMWRYSYNLRGLYETPVLSAGAEGAPARTAAERIIQRARQRRRTLLTEAESKHLLAAYGIATVETHIASSEDAAAETAARIGYPVVLKLDSETITHKTDVGGVQLNLHDEGEVRRAWHAIRISVSEKVGPEYFQGVTVQPMIRLEGYELILGSSIDPQFGPVLLFGAGGQLVEVFGDRALALPPLNTTLARRMMEQTRIFKALQGVRGREPVNLAALEELLVRFSQLVVEQRWIKEIDVNPLLASREHLLALDARVLVHGPAMTEDLLPRPAVRPYPAQYVGDWTLKNGQTVTIRPIRPEDEPLMVRFHQTLSERSVYLRYFNALKLSQRIAHDRLMRICFIDYDREMALVAVQTDPATGAQEILGVGRLSRLHGINEAEYAVLVGDQWQRQGLGTELLRRMLEIARQEKIARVVGSFLEENYEMQSVSKKLGMKLVRAMDEALVRAFIDL